MDIDWTHFTPWASLAGGVTVGLASAALVLLAGRTLGVSGIFYGTLTARGHEFAWRAAFLLGLLVAPTVLKLFSTPTPPNIEMSWMQVVIVGLLVGFGTRLGCGCTSGHGICGLSRLSPRSFVATPTFMFAGFVTVYIARHLAT
jgi:uncharacterized membrane protein YedE/YeeE